MVLGFACSRRYCCKSQDHAGIDGPSPQPGAPAADRHCLSQYAHVYPNFTIETRNRSFDVVSTLTFVLVTLPVVSRTVTVVVIVIVNRVLVHCTRLHMQVAPLQAGVPSLFKQIASPTDFSFSTSTVAHPQFLLLPSTMVLAVLGP